MEDWSSLTMGDFLAALKAVESGKIPDGKLILGDRGKSRGPLQIGKAYHQDAVGTLFPYEKVDYWKFAIRCFYAYMARYVPDALMRNDFETLARVHNGGPTGHKPAMRRSTNLYWSKVVKELKKIQESKPFLTA